MCAHACVLICCYGNPSVNIRNTQSEQLERSKEIMSHLLAIPFLYVNLSGEMIYIIEQRLQAQNVDAEKSSRGKTKIP